MCVQAIQNTNFVQPERQEWTLQEVHKEGAEGLKWSKDGDASLSHTQLGGATDPNERGPETMSRAIAHHTRESFSM